MDISNSVNERNLQETLTSVPVITLSPGFFALTTSPKCQNSVPCQSALVPPYGCESQKMK